MTRVVEIVADMPYCSVGGMVRVTSEVRPPCVGSLAPRLRLGRGADCARCCGFGKGGDCARDLGLGGDGTCVRGHRLGRDGARARAQGVGRDVARARAQGGRVRQSLHPSPGWSSIHLTPFAIFYPLNLGIPFYGTQQ